MTHQDQSFQVPPEAARIRLDRYLLEIVPGESRSQIQIWIRDGRVKVNRAPVKTGYWLRPGDTILITSGPLPQDCQPSPEDIPLHVVFQDDDIAVVEKPSGMVCHAGAGVRSGTLVNALLFHLGPFQTADALRPGIVHRLDKLTSGLLVIAKNLQVHRALSNQFKNRRVKKEYLALVYGHPNPPAGTIDVPLGRDFRDRKKISPLSRRRRDAVTHYQCERRYGPFSLLRVRIETGRTHQIRVHLAYQGHPVVGDSLYGGSRHRNLDNPGLRSAVKQLSRHFLHAHRLAFDHPRTHAGLDFISPLPPELVHFLAAIV